MSIKTKWDLSMFFKSESDPSIEEQVAKYEKDILAFVKKWDTKKDYLKVPSVMKDFLDNYSNIVNNYQYGGIVSYYFFLRNSDDTLDTDIKANLDKIDEKCSKLDNLIAPLILSIGRINKSIQSEFLESSELKEYKHFLERIFVEAKFDLTDKEEAVLRLKSAFSKTAWVSMLEKFISKEERVVLDENGKKVKKNSSEILSLVVSKDKKIRDTAAKAYYDILLRMEDVAECEFNAILGDKKVEDELRGFKRADESRHVRDDIDSNVVDTIISSVIDHAYISRNFYELKAKLLKVPKLEFYERALEYGDIDKTYSFDEGFELVKKTFHSLDTEFESMLVDAFEKGLVDVYPKKGKVAGAWTVSFTKKYPSFVKLNFAGKLRDIVTIAHEFGHYINNEYMARSQNPLNFHGTLATAEVASIFMQNFVLDEVSKSVTEEERLSINISNLTDQINAVFVQIGGYIFEQEVHDLYRKKGYLAAKDISKLSIKNATFFNGDFVKETPGAQRRWISWTHFRNYFYVYSYTNGLLIAQYLRSRVKEDKNFIKDVKKFLSVGSSKSPKDLFMDLGIDIADPKFWKKALMEIDQLLKETTYLAKKLGKT